MRHLRIYFLALCDVLKLGERAGEERGGSRAALALFSSNVDAGVDAASQIIFPFSLRFSLFRRLRSPCWRT